MRSIDSLLVPVDFSNLSVNAYRYALQLADGCKARVDLMYCIPPTTSDYAEAGLSLNLLASLQETARANMDTFFRAGLAATEATLSRVPAVSTFIETGDLAAAIRRQVEARNHDLVVMGTHGAADGWDKFWGTNASAAIARSPCPVLVIPEAADFRPFTQLAYATDLRRVDAFKAGHLLQALRPFSPRVHFVHVHTPGEGQSTEFDMDLLREVFGGPRHGGHVPTFTTIEAEAVVAGLFEYASGQGFDLVVMYRPDRSWLDRLFGKEHTREAAQQATLPLLIVGGDHLD